MVDIYDFKTEAQKVLAKLEKEKELNEKPVGDDEGLPSDCIYRNRKEAEEGLRELKELNEKHAFVHNYGGKPAVKMEVWNEVYNKKIVEFMVVDSIITIYNNRVAEETRGTKGVQTLGRWWLYHPHRKDYITVTFEPDRAPGEYHVEDKYKKKRAEEDKKNGQGDNQDIHVTYFNSWEGLGVIPKKGSWKKMRKHIYVVLCNKNKIKFKYVIKWLAWAVQNPGLPAQVALIFKGKKGAGKGLVLQSMVDIFGRHGLVISNREHLTGKHNQHLATCAFLYADEAYYPGDKEVEGILKNLITEKTLTTEPKFRELRTSRNCLHIAMATNADWVIPATEDERRYFINEVDNKYAKGECSDFIREQYFDSIWKEKKDGGLEAMLYDLLKINLTNGWVPRNSVPETEELRRQIAMSLPKLKYAFMRLLEDGIFPGSIDGEGKYVISNTNLLSHIQNMEPGNKTITGKALTKLCKVDLKLETSRTAAFRYYIFPELGELRKTWHERVTKNTEWRTNEKWELSEGNKSF